VGENEYRLLHLAPGSVGGLSRTIVEAIEAFECLPFKPARQATEWLNLNIRAGRLPMDTYLVLTVDGATLLGFFVLELGTIHVARGDLPIIQIRQKIEDPDSPQVALRLVWIARSCNAPDGFGRELFDETLVKAIEANAVAILVEPADEATAKRLWIDHFHLRSPRPDNDHPDEWQYLWYAVTPTPLNTDWT
jgi:hypothetical protein